MICNTCGANDFSITEDFEFECNYCLTISENEKLNDVIEDIKIAFLRKSNISTIIDRNYLLLEPFKFHNILREFVSRGYDYTYIKNNLGLLPKHELKIILNLLNENDNKELGVCINDPSELLDNIKNCENSLDDEVEEKLYNYIYLLAVEYGILDYQSKNDLEYLYYESHINTILTKYLEVKSIVPRRKKKIYKKYNDYLVNKKEIFLRNLEISLPDRLFDTRPEKDGLVIVKCTAKSKTIRIPMSIKGKPILTIDTGAFSSSLVQQVFIPYSVQEIKRGAFTSCNSLSEVSIGMSTMFSPDSFIKCDNLQMVDVSNSNIYTSDFGIILSKDKSSVEYCPPLNKISEYVIRQQEVIKKGAFFYSRMLRTVEILNDEVIIEESAFRIDDKSTLDVSSIDAINEVLENKEEDIQEYIDLYNSGDYKLAKIGFSRSSGKSFLSNYYLALIEKDNEDEKLDNLVLALKQCKEQSQFEMIFEELLCFEKGRSEILKILVNIKIDYLKYYEGVCYYKGYGCDVELGKARERFLVAYSNGNVKAGINAAMMLTNGIGGTVDTIYAYRIYKSLITEGHKHIILNLISLFVDNPELCDIDVNEEIQKCIDNNIEGASALYADLLISGSLIQRDIRKAISILIELSNKGDSKASYQLGYIYSIDDKHLNIDLAEKYMILAISQGNEEAKRALEKIKRVK